MVLVQKLPFFQLFFFSGNIGQENVFFDILKRKNAFVGYKNKKFKKSKNWHFPKGVNPWFWSKNGHFSNFFFRQYRPGKCVLRYSRKKKRQIRSSKSKIWHFSKGVNPRFWCKNRHFCNFLFREYRPGKCLLGYSRTKKRFSSL